MYFTIIKSILWNSFHFDTKVVVDGSSIANISDEVSLQKQT